MLDEQASPSSTVAAGTSELKDKALRGFFWAHGAYLSGRLLVFVATLVLARLLVPEDFGLVAFALTALTFVDGLKDLGLGAALVYRHDARDPKVASTAFWVGIAGALVLIGVTWAVAPAVASIGPGGEVADILRVLSIQFFLSALGSTHLSLLRHSLEFRRLVKPELAAGLVKGGVSIGLAATGFGIWSLVAGQLSGTLVRTIGLWAVSPWRPQAVVSVRAMRSMLAFGGGISAVAILSSVGRNIDYLFVGARAGATSLGFYTLAFRLPELGLLSLFQSVWDVLFPFYARLREAGGELAGPVGHALQSGYRQTLRLGSLVAFPLGAAMAALCYPLVLTLFGDRWREAAVPLALLALWAATSAVAGLPGTVFKALGRSGLMTASSVVGLAVLVPALWFTAGVGIEAVAGAQLGVRLLLLVGGMLLADRVLGLRPGRAYACLLPGLTVAVPTGLVLLAPALFLPSGAALALGVPLGVAICVAMLRLLFPGDYATLARTIRSLRRSRPDPDVQVQQASSA